MSQHFWKECSFEPSGIFQGIRTCLQGWKCKKCGNTIDLPLGTNPEQYEGTMCQGGENGNRPANSPVYGLQNNNRVQAGDIKPSNRREMRKMRSEGRV